MIEQLKSSDNFFYYGENDLNQEIGSEILSLVVQPKRSLFYSRGLGSAAIDDYENSPNTIVLRVIVPYEILLAISKRNNNVGNGQNGTKERRVSSSQNLVTVKQENGEADITVLYIPFFNQIESTVNNKSGIGGI